MRSAFCGRSLCRERRTGRGAWLLLCLKQYGLQLAVCFVLCTDLGKKLWQTLGGARAGRALRYAVLALVFFLSVLTLTGSGMQAFIYARF